MLFHVAQTNLKTQHDPTASASGVLGLEMRVTMSDLKDDTGKIKTGRKSECGDAHLTIPAPGKQKQEDRSSSLSSATYPVQSQPAALQETLSPRYIF